MYRFIVQVLVNFDLQYRQISYHFSAAREAKELSENNGEKIPTRPSAIVSLTVIFAIAILTYSLFSLRYLHILLHVVVPGLSLFIEKQIPRYILCYSYVGRCNSDSIIDRCGLCCFTVRNMNLNHLDYDRLILYLCICDSIKYMYIHTHTFR